MTRCASAFVALLLTASVSPAQPAPTFEVATIKPNRSGERGEGASPVAGGRFLYKNGTLRSLLKQAYRVKDYQIAGGQGWMAAERFDIEAKAESRTTLSQAWVMVRSLLVERFQLKFHRETREMPVYLLTVEAKGAKVQATGPGNGGRVRNRAGSLDAEDITMGMLAHWLESSVPRPVIDRTGLAGGFHIKLDWSPTQGEVGAESGVTTDAAGPTLFTALREKLGLRLEAGKAPIEVLVIDHAARPTAN
jgi:uncharacterized protein (TIGR03435 family)